MLSKRKVNLDIMNTHILIILSKRMYIAKLFRSLIFITIYFTLTFEAQNPYIPFACKIEY